MKRSVLMPLRQFGFLACAALLLAGCMAEEIQQKVQADRPVVEAGVRKAEQPAAPISYDPLQVTDSVFTGAQAVRMRRGLPLPSNLEGSRAITLVSAQGMSLPDIAAFISNHTGIAVRLTDGAERLGVGGAAPAPTTATGTAARPAVAGGTASGGAAAVNSAGTDIRPMVLAYEGPLSGLLDAVAGHYGINWRYDGKGLNISRFETRTFVVEAMPGTAAITDGLQAESQGGGSSGGDTSSGGGSGTSSLDQKSEMKATLDYWTELKDSMETILGGVGALKISPSAGTVTVITTPEIMRTVAQHMEQENRRNTRQVAITVELFTLSLDDAENFSTNLDVAFQDLDIGDFSFTSPGLGDLTSETGGEISAGVLSPTSKWSGSEGLVRALATLGNVTRVARIPVTTLNNRPASRRIGRDKAYLASVSVSQSGDSNFQQASLTPGVVREGFSLQVTPRILGDGRILIQYSLSIIELLRDPIEQFDVGENSVQLPETSSRVFVQQALLQNGDSLVLSGFDEDRQSANRQGFGSPYNWLMGGSATGSKTREMFFLTMTPREIDVPRRLSEW